MTTRSQPLVTIAIPTHNRADSYLREVLGCALNQTYQNIEIIVSDNCSTDSTEKTVRSFLDSLLRYYRHDRNIGANNNFNFCLSQARGDYFLLLHDDDLIDEDFVQVCMQSANYATNIGVIRTGTRVIDSQGSVLRESPNRAAGLSLEEFFRAWFAHKTSLYLCSTLFNTGALREVGGFGSKHNLFQDGVAVVQLAARLGRADVQDIKASFRWHPEQRTHAVKVSEWCEDSLMLLDLMCNVLREEKALVRTEGLLFFAELNYRRAANVGSALQRLMAYLIVLRAFNYRYIPPPVRDYCHRSSIYQRLLLIRRRLRQALPGVRH